MNTERDDFPMLTLVQRILRKHRIVWHGGGTGVSASCRCRGWCGNYADLDEAFAGHEDHIARKIVHTYRSMNLEDYCSASLGRRRGCLNRATVWVVMTKTLPGGRQSRAKTRRCGDHIPRTAISVTPIDEGRPE